ncbi:S8 family peptidase [Prauserella rugosa]|uniref:Subtilisin family serine protease n=1 Tax=Prauserella rugosa TaxID=43354 RepID=A0A660C988_9PSEU|nr:S8 family peptidase [Prauserella rugosa]KID29805.1 subtilisin-like serine protease [Prauserella sp. Am3]KMS84385.1 serine protease [Streptomyces regensis]TWH18904.1 subtilisin family serine protease [Prauserella rugosa]
MGNSRKLRRSLNAGVVAAGVTGLVAAGLGTAAAAPEGQILSANTPNAVDGSYIVVLNDSLNAKSVTTAATQLADRYGADVAKTYSSALDGFSVKASEAEAKRLAANPSVDYVVQNQRVHATETQSPTPSWGLDRIDQAELPLDDSYTYSTTADNVTAYIIDTGVDASHEDFGDRVQPGQDFVDGGGDGDDQQGHGTHVAGTVAGSEYGVAKGASIVPVRVLDANGSGTTEGVISGVDWVAQNAEGPAVANMSLGGTADQALDTAVEGAIEAGVTFVAAAGNESADAGNGSPSRVESAITVAASDENDAQAEFSNYGSVVDLYAPGVDITSAAMGGGETTMSGTSMAAPHVAGAAALYLADNPQATPAEVSEALTSSATEGAISNPTGETPNLLLNTGQE